MKKVWTTLGVLLVAVPVLALGWLYYSTDANHAAPTAEALAALSSDATVNIESGEWLIMKPPGARPDIGIILYPGAYCDIRGYAPVMRRIAAAGYLVVGVTMPFDFAIFAPGRATDVREAFPDIKRWVIAGHSMGGSMAGMYAYEHQDELAGLMFWDAYPPPGNSLADSSLPVLHIHRSRPNGDPPSIHQEHRDLFPASSEWVPIPEGLHMYFGSFDGGVYEESWEAGIPRERQQDMVVAAAVAWLQRIPSRM